MCLFCVVMAFYGAHSVYLDALWHSYIVYTEMYEPLLSEDSSFQHGTYIWTKKANAHMLSSKL